jgi:hypothetical protein
MDETGNQARSPFIDGPQFELAHQQHAPVKVEQLFMGII